MFFNSLPNPKTYTKYYWVIENDKKYFVAEAESKLELEQFFGHGNVFDSKTDVITEFNIRKAPKNHKTDEERRLLELEQLAYGNALMTETEKAEVIEERKTTDELQLEFARMMQQTENEWCRC